MLQHVKELKDALDIPVLSNGNVRTFDAIFANLAFTSADGLMVGDALLKNP
jgi:tRNA-dihydrouridine synthase 1